MMISVILVFLEFLRFLIWKKFKEMTSEIGYEVSFLDIIFLIGHNLLLFCHPTPLLVGRKIEVYNAAVGANIYYYANDIFYTIQIYKVMVLTKYILTNSKYMSTRAHRVW